MLSEPVLPKTPELGISLPPQIRLEPIQATDITFAGVVEAIRKSLKRRRDQVRYSTIVSGGILPSELEQGSSNIGNATVTEMAEFKVPCNRRIIVS